MIVTEIASNTHTHVYIDKRLRYQSCEEAECYASTRPYSLSSPEIRTMARLHKMELQPRIGPRIGKPTRKLWGRRHGSSSSAGLENKVVVINTHICPHPPDPYIAAHQDKSNRKQIRMTLSPPLFASPCSSCPPVSLITQSHTSTTPLSTDPKEFPTSYSSFSPSSSLVLLLPLPLTLSFQKDHCNNV